jgi:hypothetical protein
VGTSSALYLENDLIEEGMWITETEFAVSNPDWGGCRMPVRFNELQGNETTPGPRDTRVLRISACCLPSSSAPGLYSYSAQWLACELFC